MGDRDGKPGRITAVMCRRPRCERADVWVGDMTFIIGEKEDKMYKRHGKTAFTQIMIISLFIVLVCPVSPFSSMPSYEIIDLGESVHPTAINNSGEIVGWFLSGT